MFKHILIPTDGSRVSTEAAKAGVRLARRLGARVTGFFAAPPATPIVYRDALPVGYTTPEHHEKMIRRAAQAHLTVIERAAKAAGVRCECVTVTSDFPAEAILEAATRRGCDLIFMASHSRRGLKGLLLGSQTHKVLAGSTVPVLVYRSGRAGS
jgi:nucleotide-binding universal stress UspA family protein